MKQNHRSKPSIRVATWKDCELDTVMATGSVTSDRAAPSVGALTSEEEDPWAPHSSHAPPGKGRRKGGKGRSRESVERSSRERSGGTAETDDWENASSILESAPSSAEGPQCMSRVRKKWRGGPLPAAPHLHATFDNVYKVPKMSTQWCRQVDAWKLRVRHCKPFAWIWSMRSLAMGL